MRIISLKGSSYEVDDYKDWARTFLPCIDSIGFSEDEDEKIQIRLVERLIAYTEAQKVKGVFEGRTCLFDRIEDAYKGDKYAKAILRFINDNIINIERRLDKVLYSKLTPTLLDLFINFENNGSQSHYLSRVGEIAVLDRILSKDELVLIDIERKLPNGKHIDFVIQYQEQDILAFIEVDNIELKIDKVNCVDDLKGFLEKRFLDKINTKLEGLDKKRLLKELNFSLVPVLWGALDDFAEYVEISDWIAEVKPRISPAYGIHYLGLPDGTERYVFETIDNMRAIKTKIK